MNKLNHEQFEVSQSFFFLGLGGIGMSALARMLRAEGKEVTGSDISLSHVTSGLEDDGIHVIEGQSLELIPNNIDVVVYTKAISAYAPEILSSLDQNGTQLVSYPELLGLVSHDSGKLVAVAGTHGKTTTSAMITDVLSDGGKNPTAIIGSIMARHQSNYVAGDSEVFVAEACEYQDSFLNLDPKILVITNIEADHLDYFGTEDNVVKSFVELSKKIPSDGYVVLNSEGKHSQKITPHVRGSIVDYSNYLGKDFGLKTPGEYNRQNAAAAFAVGEIFDIPEATILESLSNFDGTWRRAEYKGTTSTKASVFDDYAHHPTEIKSFLSGMREKFPNKNIIAIFEPHLFSRTKLLFKDFASSFSNADEVIVMPIYFAREEKDNSITSVMLSESIGSNGVTSSALGSYDEVRDYVLSMSDENSIICTIGAGTIAKLSDMLT